MGQLFKENVFTPFNWYIVETMPKVIEFIDNICQVKLPTFIDKLINDYLKIMNMIFLKKIQMKIFYIEIYAIILMNYIL